MTDRKQEIFTCACGAPQHTFYITKYSDEPEFYFNIQLSHWLPWYQRIYHAIKYIFGSDCGWDETVLEESEAERLIEFLMKN